MADTMLKIGIDVGAARAAADQASKLIAEKVGAGGQEAAAATGAAFKDTAKDVEKTLSAAVEKATTHATKVIAKIYGNEMVKRLGPETIKKSVSQGLAATVKDQKHKEDAKKIGDSVALSISKQLGFKIDSKVIRKSIDKSLSEAEREAAQKRTGVERMFGRGAVVGGAAEEMAAHPERMPGMGAPSAAEKRKEEEHRSKLTSTLHNVGKAIATVGLAAGGGLLAGMVTAFRAEAKATTQMAPYTGVGGANRALVAGNALNLSRGESVGAATQAARRGVGVEAGVMGATRLGFGGEFSQYLGGREAQTGERFQAGEFGAAGKRGGGLTRVSIADVQGRGRAEFQRAVGLGVSTGLEKGRLGEIFTGLEQMEQGRSIGRGVSSEALNAMMLRAGESGLRGGSAFQAMRGGEGLLREPGTGLGKAIGLQAVGFGEKGGPGFFTAQAKMRQGLFGSGVDVKESQRRGQALTEGYRKTFGFEGKLGHAKKGATPEEEERRQMVLTHAAEAAGMSPEDMEKVFSVLEKSDVTQKELKKLADVGKSNEEKQLGVMKSISDKSDGIEKNIEEIFNHLSEMLDAPIHKLLDITELLVDAVESIPGVRATRVEKQMAAAHQQQIGFASKIDPKKLKVLAGGEISKLKEERAKWQEESAAAGLAGMPGQALVTPGTKTRATAGEELAQEFIEKTGRFPQEGAAGMAELQQVLGAGKTKKLGEGGLGREDLALVAEKLAVAAADMRTASGKFGAAADKQSDTADKQGKAADKLASHGQRGRPSAAPDHPDVVRQNLEGAGSTMGAH